MKRLLLCSIIFLTGCATKHPPIVVLPGGGLEYACPKGEDCSKYPAPHWEDGGTKPDQLTPAGCLLHKVVTLGHTAQECRKTKRSKP